MLCSGNAVGKQHFRGIHIVDEACILYFCVFTEATLLTHHPKYWLTRRAKSGSLLPLVSTTAHVPKSKTVYIN